LRYLGKIFWPENLAIFYPYIKDYAVLQIAASLIALAGISVVAVVLSRLHRYVLTGWLSGILETLCRLKGLSRRLIRQGQTVILMFWRLVFYHDAMGIPALLQRWTKGDVVFAIAAEIILVLSGFLPFIRPGFGRTALQPLNIPSR
jgi:hypothetical protein